MLVEKQKLDAKVKELKDSVQVDVFLRLCCLNVINVAESLINLFSDGRSVH